MSFIGSGAENFMDDALLLVQKGQELEAMQLIVSSLYQERINNFKDWPAFVEKFRKHPVMVVTQECQITARSFNKPRGYAGDAIMLDDMYGLIQSFPHSTTLAGKIYFYTTNTPESWAVRDRRTLLARLIDETSDRTGAGRVLALACGHARELALSSAYAHGRLGEYVAFDQDRLSLEVVESECNPDYVTVIHGNIRNIIARKLELGEFDLVYAAGLFDYLSQPVAQRLAAKMYSSLKPGGKMLVPNFLPNIPGVGYMEACMDWWLVYRDQKEIADIFSDLPQVAKDNLEVFCDAKNCIGYGIVTKPI